MQDTLWTFTFYQKYFYDRMDLRLFYFSCDDAWTPEVFLWRSVLRNMQQIYKRTSILKSDSNKAVLQLYRNHTSTWVFSCKFVVYFGEHIFIRTHLGRELLLYILCICLATDCPGLRIHSFIGSCVSQNM